MTGHRSRLLLAVTAVVLTFLTDQATKLWALETLWLPYQVVVEVLPVWNLRLGFNTGMIFGMFRESAAGAVWALVLLKLGVVTFLARWLCRGETRLEALALGLIIGGALGNVLDRVRIGAVVDFLDWHYAGWHWPTFNVTNVAIVSGIGLLPLSGLNWHEKKAVNSAGADRRSEP